MMHIIGGQFKKRKLFTPKTTETRPSKNILRESLFNILAPYIEGAIFLDLFAGSGAIGFEALSRGAQKIIFIENQKAALEAIKKNAALLKVENSIQILEKNVYQELPKVPSFFDIIFADPPYAKDGDLTYLKLFDILEKHPILNEGGRFFLETHAKETSFPIELKTLTLYKKRKIGNSQLLEYTTKNSELSSEE
jgi:16S rRNA (guanine966-N2)-methyltransferase